MSCRANQGKLSQSQIQLESQDEGEYTLPLHAVRGPPAEVKEVHTVSSFVEDPDLTGCGLDHRPSVLIEVPDMRSSCTLIVTHTH